MKGSGGQTAAWSVVFVVVLSSAMAVVLVTTPAVAGCEIPVCEGEAAGIGQASGVAQSNGTAGGNATDGSNATTDGPNATAQGRNATGGSNATTSGTNATTPDANGTTGDAADDEDVLVLNGTVLPDYAPFVFRDVAGEVAVEDGVVAVRGSAPGLDEVLVVAIDSRGRIASRILAVDRSDVFREDDFPLVTPDGEELTEGPIVGAVFGVGRDGYVGDGEIAGFEEADLRALDDRTRERAQDEIGNGSDGRTPVQILEWFYDESVDDGGSDDVALVDGFRYADGRTVVESVVPATESNTTGIRPITVGETAVVSGHTNRKPGDTVIAVAVVDGPTPREFPIETTDDWGTDGDWTVEIDTDGAESGTYTLESDDGDYTDEIEFEIVPEEGDGAAGNATSGSNNSTAMDPVTVP